ncbi:MAG: type IX secretion system outer membrane channel protein PorV [Bacteroidales bacterium]|nr:type IX secretion system outer membrane channel protein PorV [Candidatus Colicola faecequi]
MKKIALGLFALALSAMPLMAEEVMNPIITAMPSLSIAPDAHAGGLGDVGAATTPDLNSQHWNPAKYAFMESHGGITANYTPWLTKLVNDINLAYIAGYYNISDKAGALGMSFTYFGLGDVQLTDMFGEELAMAAPNEWAIDLSYSRKLHEYVSMAVAMRFLYSDLNNGVNAGNTGGSAMELYPGWTMAADVALYYRQPIELSMGTSYFALGLNVSNLGGKISYDENNTSSFIPANLRLGASYELAFDNYNRLSINADVNKYLVPASKGSKYAVDENGNPLEGQALKQWYYNLSSPRGWGQSFADAPGGFKEEMREIQYGVGLEYSYDRKFFGRVGYSHENQWKGNRRYVTLGAGFHLSIVTLDVSYVIATAASNPLDNTLRFSLGFDLAGIKDLVNNKK